MRRALGEFPISADHRAYVDDAVGAGQSGYPERVACTAKGVTADVPGNWLQLQEFFFPEIANKQSGVAKIARTSGPQNQRGLELLRYSTIRGRLQDRLRELCFATSFDPLRLVPALVDPERPNLKHCNSESHWCVLCFALRLVKEYQL